MTEGEVVNLLFQICMKKSICASLDVKSNFFDRLQYFSFNRIKDEGSFVKMMFLQQILVNGRR